MVTTLFWGLLVLIVLQRAFELLLSEKNRRHAIRAGARETGAGHYPLMVLLHSAWLLGWAVEAWRRGPGLDDRWWLWLGLFAVSQVLRYWVMTSLGRHWSTRIVVIPGDHRVRSGPYRYLNHPNYVVVVLELLSVPMVFGAWVTALVASALNALLLLLVRIPAENKALKSLR